jgi:hypothetical protein
MSFVPCLFVKIFSFQIFLQNLKVTRIFSFEEFFSIIFSNVVLIYVSALVPYSIGSKWLEIKHGL